MKSNLMTGVAYTDVPSDQILSDGTTASGQTHVGDSFDFLGEQISEIQDLIYCLEQRIEVVLGPELEVSDGSATTIPFERSRLVNHIRSEGNRLKDLNRKLRGILDRIEI